MRVFICVRSEANHDGALIIAASNETEACKIYGEHENYYNRNPVLPLPQEVKELPLLYCDSDKAAVIYDDYSR